MSHLACPTCRQFVSDQALDAGECPFCGYDGAMVAAASPKHAWLLSTLAVVLCGGALGAYLLVPRNEPTRVGAKKVALAPSPLHQAKPAELAVAPPPRLMNPPPRLPVAAAPFAPLRKNPWNPNLAVEGPVERIDATAVRAKRIEAREGVVSVSDMNRDDRLTLTGTVRQLRIGTVGGNAILDASGLAAQEIIVTGDVHGSATVKLNAPDGNVSIGGHIEGTAKVVVNAPRGEVLIGAASGKLDGGGELTVIARSVEATGTMAGNAKLIVTLTGGGRVTLGAVQENASVVYVPLKR
jgi:hypothetical protein